MDIQVRGPGGFSGNGTYGIGIIGINYTYSLSGGTNGVQLQGQLTVLGIAVRGTYQSGIWSDSNYQVQAGVGETFGASSTGGGVNGFAGIGYSKRDGIVESVSASGTVFGYNISFSQSKVVTLLPQGDYFFDVNRGSATRNDPNDLTPAFSSGTSGGNDPNDLTPAFSPGTANFDVFTAGTPFNDYGLSGAAGQSIPGQIGNGDGIGNWWSNTSAPGFGVETAGSGGTNDGSVFSTGAPSFNSYNIGNTYAYSGSNNNINNSGGSNNNSYNGNDYNGSSYNGNDYAGNGDSGGGSDFGPVVLDLAGNGINITRLSSSNTYQDVRGDGYKSLTAWAGAGNGVLFVDLSGQGQLTQRNQIVFTDWDPGAASDMQALLDVFDTNHNGMLDAGDANFSKFFVMVTNADGTQTAQSLASLGISSINLNADATHIALADGSSIDGETTFTTISGATHVAATVTLAADANGYLVTTRSTLNVADGSRTIANTAQNADGSLAYQRVLNISADGLSRTLTNLDSS